MKLRGMIAGLLVAVALTGCARSATAPEAQATVDARPSFDNGIPTPPDTTSNRSGGAMGTGT